MSMSRPQGLGRDPKYPGKFGIPDYIVNTPQKPAQWWAVAMLALLLALPFGVWGMLDRGGTLVTVGYLALVVLTASNAWLLRNDINETVPYLALAIVSGIIVLAASVFTAAFRAFPKGHPVAGVLMAAVALIALHN